MDKKKNVTSNSDCVKKVNLGYKTPEKWEECLDKLQGYRPVCLKG